jgi:hypothetical protein
VPRIVVFGLGLEGDLRRMDLVGLTRLAVARSPRDPEGTASVVTLVAGEDPGDDLGKPPRDGRAELGRVKASAAVD